MTAADRACPADDVFARLCEGVLAGADLRALEEHCDLCAACGRTLAELARTVAEDGGSGGGRGGEWLDERYRLHELLGAGSTGMVYTAFDSKLRRKVAVKRLRDASSAAGASADKRRARFLREAQLLAGLSHPNVLTVHDLGGGDGELYVVMELVDGWPMSRWIDRAAEPSSRASASPSPSPPSSPPGWRQIVDLYLQAGRGLSAAHRLGVVHRDVKPENILVARNGRVLIGDFGLAGLMDAGVPAGAGPGSHPELTQTGAVLGTPAYMAPEQHDGKASDALSDQFSFCVSLFESLHGRRPFAGSTAAQIAAAVRAGQLAPGGDGVPRAVDRVLAIGLAADPARRHASMDALVVELGRARDRRVGRPLLAAGALVGLGAVAVAVVAAALGREANVAQPVPSRAAPAAGAALGAAAATPKGAPAPAAGPPAAPAVGLGQVAPPLPGRRRPAARPSVRGGGRAEGGHHVSVRDVGEQSRDAPVPAVDRELDRELEVDHAHLLFLADRAHRDRDGDSCVTALDQVGGARWPAALGERAQRRRALCEMLRGNCERGRRLLEPLDSPESVRRSLLGSCPTHAFATLEDRVLALAVQADETRYGGNQPSRRKELEQALLAETASTAIQTCFRDRRASGSGCGRLLTLLAQAYQAMAESFLVGADCREGALLDVMHSQVRFMSLDPDEGDPALRCRARRVFDVYKSCVAAGEEAEGRCLARGRGAEPMAPELGR